MNNLFYFMNNARLAQLIKKIFSSLPKGEALDLGAGTGDKTLLIQKAGFQVTALEYKRKNAALLREKGFRTVCRDMKKFKFAKSFYSLVFASASLDFLGRKDKISALKKIYSSLKPDGHIFFFVFSKKDPLHKYAQKFHKTEKETYVFPKKIKKHADQISFFSKEEWQKILSKTGFKKVFIKEIYIEEWQPSRHDHHFYMITAKK